MYTCDNNLIITHLYVTMAIFRIITINQGYSMHLYVSSYYKEENILTNLNLLGLNVVYVLIFFFFLVHSNIILFLLIDTVKCVSHYTVMAV